MPKLRNEQLRGITFASSNRWTIEFLRPPVGVLENWPAKGIQDLLCTSASQPKMTMETREVIIKGQTVQSPGDYKFDHEITLNFVENVDSVIAKWIKAWRDACYNIANDTPEAEFGSSLEKPDLVTDILLKRLNNNDIPVMQYKLLSCFLKDYEPGGELDSEGDLLRPTMTISYDKFIDKFLT